MTRRRGAAIPATARTAAKKGSCHVRAGACRRLRPAKACDDYRAGAASALRIQPRSAYLHTVNVESLSRPLALFTTRSRLQGAPSLAVNCPRTCAQPDAPVLAFDHDCFALAP